MKMGHIHQKLSICLAVLLMTVIIPGTVAFAETVVGDVEARLNEGRIEYGGETYRPKRRLTSVLVMGVDRETDSGQTEGYRDGGQADYILLLIVDDNACAVTPVLLDRDLMTEIVVLSVFGQETGTWTTQLCRAHSFGDGREQSCRLTADAVSRLMMDITIDHYAALDLSSIPVLNDALGGVTVTLEEDLTAYDPAMKAGAEITLSGKQAEYYVRMRYDVGDGSNALRMSRQRTYMMCAAEQMKERIKASSAFINTLFDALEPYLVTDMSRGAIVNLGNRMAKYEIGPIMELEGERSQGSDGLMEFYADPEALERMVINLYYERIE